jgi:hypothetical protein
MNKLFKEQEDQTLSSQKFMLSNFQAKKILRHILINWKITRYDIKHFLKI